MSGIGEMLGIGVAGSLAVAVNILLGEPASFLEKTLVLGVMLIAGLFEGSSIAWFQWSVLRRKFTSMLFKNWWKYTVTVALLGWFFGSLPSLFFVNGNNPSNVTEPSMLLIILIAIAGGAVAGLLFGWFQGLELKRHTSNWKLWIPANSLAWAVALAVIFYAATWPDANTPVFQIIISAVIGGCVAGLSLGMLTGFFLIRMK